MNKIFAALLLVGLSGCIDIIRGEEVALPMSEEPVTVDAQKYQYAIIQPEKFKCKKHGIINEAVFTISASSDSVTYSRTELCAFCFVDFLNKKVNRAIKVTNATPTEKTDKKTQQRR